MLYAVRLIGDSPIIHHSAAGIDTTSEWSREINEITKKRGTNRTEADELRLKELETLRSIWYECGEPAIPHAAIRAVVETGARKLKQGPLVREGLIVQETAFEFDRDRYGSTPEKWAVTTQFTVPVVVQRNRIMRTRARFDLPWAVEAKIYGDDELIDATKLTTWLDIAGQRIGLGDWRPEKSGSFGRFRVESVEPI